VDNPAVPLLLATGLYLWTAYGFAMRGSWGDVLAFLCYAGANIGFAFRPEIEAAVRAFLK
jgi:hypothetical protein